MDVVVRVIRNGTERDHAGSKIAAGVLPQETVQFREKGRRNVGVGIQEDNPVTGLREQVDAPVFCARNTRLLYADDLGGRRGACCDNTLSTCYQASPRLSQHMCWQQVHVAVFVSRCG